ncbi:hypothetical protein TRVA0_048S00232 [Trichomonascus vanleenenianus]|uniref:uncharacterized protein n=1 Tax=Trichomonascus vanleenenianus TaxID=2268995 RepID=UPI003ECB09A3
MVSKLSAVSLALAFALSSAQDCTLSQVGSDIVTDIGILVYDNNAFLQAITGFDGSVGGADNIASQMNTIFSDVRSVYDDLYISGPNDCDYQTVAGLLVENAPTLASTLQSLADMTSAILSANQDIPFIEQQLGLLSSIITDLVDQVPVWLPSQYADQATTDALTSITSALNAVLAAFYPATTTSLPSVPTSTPTSILSNPTSTLTSVPTSTPTPPPTTTPPPSVCRKKQQQPPQES